MARSESYEVERIVKDKFCKVTCDACGGLIGEAGGEFSNLDRFPFGHRPAKPEDPVLFQAGNGMGAAWIGEFCWKCFKELDLLNFINKFIEKKEADNDKKNKSSSS